MAEQPPTPFLATVAAGSREIRLARIVVAIFAVIIIALVPFAREPAPQLLGFIPSYQSALLLGDLITATLLFSQFARIKSGALLVLAGAYLFTGLLAFVHMLSFPGLFSPGGLLGAHTQTTVWLYMFWHTGFPVAVIVAMTMPPRTAANASSAILAAILSAAALTIACVLLATKGASVLPALLHDDNTYTLAMRIVSGTIWAATFAALVAIVRHRPRSMLDVWLAIVMSAWLGDTALSVILNAHRFDVGYYAGRLFGLVAANLVLGGLLLETGRLYAQLVDSLRREADERELRLRHQEEARAAAESASVAKSGFLANMSHEIRTPLNGVIGNLELLGQTTLNDEQCELIAHADNASKSLLALIGNILDFSKIEAGKLSIELGEVNPAAIVEEAVDVLQSRARQKNIFVTAAFGANLPRLVIGDGARLRQILLNLVGNAVKFTDRGGVQARLLVDGEEDNGKTCRLRFEVNDSGPGFDDKVAAKIFQPFAQDSASGHAAEGTGLGLSICRSLVETFGGQIGCEATPGEGATFWLTLSVPVVAPGEPARKPNLAGREIVIAASADDDVSWLADHLAARGATVVPVPDLAAAAARLAHARPGQRVFETAFVAARMMRVENAGHIARLRERHAVSIVFGPDSAAAQRRALGLGFAGVVRVDAPDAAAILDRNARLLVGQAPPDQGHAIRADTAYPAGLKGKRVLVLEDRLVNQMVIQKQLKIFDISCAMASNGIQGLEIMARQGFDVVLCDCSMPEMNGYEFTERVRQREREDGKGEHLPIIALTANAFREDVEKCHAAGMDDFISKPVMLPRLAAVLSRWLNVAAPLPTGTSEHKLADTSVIDLHALAELMGSADEAALTQVLTAFLPAARAALVNVRSAILREDRQEVAEIAHGAKGEARNAGAITLGRLYASIERDAVQGNGAGFGALIAQTDEEVARVERFISTRIRDMAT